MVPRAETGDDDVKTLVGEEEWYDAARDAPTEAPSERTPWLPVEVKEEPMEPPKKTEGQNVQEQNGKWFWSGKGSGHWNGFSKWFTTASLATAKGATTKCAFDSWTAIASATSASSCSSAQSENRAPQQSGCTGWSCPQE